MNAQHITGLGKPQPVGKYALFQPPAVEEEVKSQTVLPQVKPETKGEVKKNRPETLRRVHITIDVTSEALQIIQRVQQAHRLRTGKVLPLWRAVSQAIEAYEKQIQK